MLLMYTWIKSLFLWIFFGMLACGGIHVGLLKNKTAKSMLKTLTGWVLATAGMMGIAKGYLQLFHPDLYSNFVGWQLEVPWQYDVGVMNVAIGLLGLLSIFIHGSFWIAAIIALTIRDWGFAIGHYIQLLHHYDLAIGNVGILVYLEIIHPIIAIVLFIAYCNVKKINNKL